MFIFFVLVIYIVHNNFRIGYCLKHLYFPSCQRNFGFCSEIFILNNLYINFKRNLAKYLIFVFLIASLGPFRIIGYGAPRICFYFAHLLNSIIITSWEIWWFPIAFSMVILIQSSSVSSLSRLASTQG